MFKGKKAITPVIALLILLMITTSAAGAAFFWLNKITGQVEEEHENFEIVDIGIPGAEVTVLASDYNSITKKLIFFLKNTGEIEIPLTTVPGDTTTIWLLEDLQGNIICSTDWSGKEEAPTCELGCDATLKQNEIRKVILGSIGKDLLCDTTESKPDNVMTYKIDFSGLAVSRGTFIV
jgi:flagellin-like protein